MLVLIRFWDIVGFETILLICHFNCRLSFRSLPVWSLFVMLIYSNTFALQFTRPTLLVIAWRLQPIRQFPTTVPITKSITWFPRTKICQLFSKNWMRTCSKNERNSRTKSSPDIDRSHSPIEWNAVTWPSVHLWCNGDAACLHVGGKFNLRCRNFQLPSPLNFCVGFWTEISVISV